MRFCIQVDLCEQWRFYIHFIKSLLRRANMSSIEATLMASQLRWTGHIIRVNDSRLPKAVFYGELSKGKRLRGGQRLWYKDVVKRHLKATHITVDHCETLAQDRQQWRQAIHTVKSHIEEKISQKYQHDHHLRHGFPDASAPIIFCVNCGRGFQSQIGLFSHQRAKHVTNETLHWCHHWTRWTAKKKKNIPIYYLPCETRGEVF